MYNNTFNASHALKKAFKLIIGNDEEKSFDTSLHTLILVNLFIRIIEFNSE